MYFLKKNHAYLMTFTRQVASSWSKISNSSDITQRPTSFQKVSLFKKRRDTQFNFHRRKLPLKCTLISLFIG